MSQSKIPFEPRQYLEPIRTFLQDYPGLQPWEILTIDYLKYTPFTGALPPGAGLITVAGSNAVQTTQYILGDHESNVQDNYIFLIKRSTGDNELRREFGDFVRDYVRWINTEQTYRNTALRHPLLPRFSNFDNPDEVFAANGEMQSEVAVDTQSGLDIDVFQLQVQVRYKLQFESEDY